MKSILAVTAAYNDENSLSELISSINEQSRLPGELLIIDNSDFPLDIERMPECAERRRSE